MKLTSGTENHFELSGSSCLGELGSWLFSWGVEGHLDGRCKEIELGAIFRAQVEPLMLVSCPSKACG